MTETTIPIPARLKNVAQGGHVAGSEDIDAGGNKNQKQVNDDVNLGIQIINDKIGTMSGNKTINERLDDIEAAESITYEGGEAQIAQGSDFTNPDATKRAKIPTVGAIVDGLNDGIYDVSKRNPTAGPNSDGKFTLDYILNNVNTLIPTGWRHGGMTISFVQSSDNKYVQYLYVGTSTAAADFTNVANWIGAKNTYNIPRDGTYHEFSFTKNHAYVFTNTGSATVGLYYKVDAESDSVTIKYSLAVGSSYTFVASEDAGLVAISSISGAAVTITYGVNPDIEELNGRANSIENNLENTNQSFSLLSGRVTDVETTLNKSTLIDVRGSSVPFSFIKGRTYTIVNNSNSKTATVYYSITGESGTGVLIGNIPASGNISFKAPVNASYVYVSNVGDVTVTISESLKRDVDNLVTDVANNTEAITEPNAIQLTKGTNTFTLTSGHLYLFKNTGTISFNFGYKVTSNSDTVIIENSFGVGKESIYKANETSNYIVASNTSGVSFTVKDLGNLYEQLNLLEKEETILTVGSYNMGDFTGVNLTRFSDECDAAYRNAITELNANVLVTQEDLGSDVNVRSHIMGMWKYYKRLGNRDYNFKSVGSDYLISSVKSINYTIPEGSEYEYAHTYFLVGNLILKNKNILVVSIHFDWQDINRRREQISQVINYCAGYDYVIIGGDTNPSNRINGEIVDPTQRDIHTEDWAIFSNAGYSLANGGYFGDMETIWDSTTQSWYCFDNIFVKGGVIKKANVVKKEWMNDHLPIYATVVF